MITNALFLTALVGVIDEPDAIVHVLRTVHTVKADALQQFWAALSSRALFRHRDQPAKQDRAAAEKLDVHFPQNPVNDGIVALLRFLGASPKTSHEDRDTFLDFDQLQIGLFCQLFISPHRDSPCGTARNHVTPHSRSGLPLRAFRTACRERAGTSLHNLNPPNPELAPSKRSKLALKCRSVPRTGVSQLKSSAVRSLRLTAGID